MSSPEKTDELTPDGYESLFDGRETERVANLVIGAPGPDTLKRSAAIFARAAAHRASQSGEDGGALFQYGPRTGCRSFKVQMAKFLSDGYEDVVREENLVLTSGATAGLWLTATTLLPPGRGIVFIECPSYFIALDILEKDCGHKSVAVPMAPDGTGVDVAELEEAVKREHARRVHPEGQGKFWAMFYTIPTFHNPTGSVMSPEKCSKVVELARRYDFVVVCDDVYNLLHYGPASKSPKRLLAYDTASHSEYKGNVISNGTFSKILGPGYRVGWLEVPSRLMPAVYNSGVLNSGGAMNNVAAGVVTSALELGLQQDHLQHLREEYHRRLSAIFQVFDSKLPECFACRRPGGGYFMWVSGPPDFDSDAFSKWCLKEREVQVLPSSACGAMPSGKRVTDSFRVSLAFYEEDKLRGAMEKLCDALNDFGRNQGLHKGKDEV